MQEKPVQPVVNDQNRQLSSRGLDQSMPYEAIVRLASRNQGVLFGLIGLALVLGVIYIQIATPQFTSSAKLYIESSSPKLLKEGEQAKTSKNYLYTQATVVKSTTVLERVLDQLQQSTDSHIANKVLQQSNPATYLSHHLSTNVGKKDDILQITFTSDDPLESSELTQQVVDAYVAYNTGKVQNTSGQILRILQKEKADTDHEFVEKLTRLTEFKKNNKDVIFGNDKKDIMTDRLARLSNALTEAQLNAVEAETYYKTILSMSSDPAQLRQYVRSRHADEPAISGTSESVLLRNKINHLQLQLEKILRVLTPEHPSVKAMEDKIATTFQQLETVEKEYVQAQEILAYQKYTAAVEKQQKVQTHYEQQRKTALNTNEKLSEYLLLESDWKQTQKMSDLLTERIREVDITENTGALNIHILESPQVAQAPSSPNIKRVLVLSVIFGTAMGVCVSLVRDFFDNRFCCDREIMATVGSPVLGVVPQIPRGYNAELVSYTHPDSTVAQIYRKICASLFFGQLRDTNRTFHICSARAKAGKTVTVCNLGIAMAQANQRTLLIDCNFNQLRLKDVFGLKGTVGISEVIQKGYALPEAIENTFIQGLDLIDGGHFLGNPIKLFNSKKFHSIIRILRCQYDRILIDSQSIMEFPESLILSHLADVSLLAIHGEYSNLEDTAQIQNEHESIRAAILGVIVTQVLSKGSCYQHQQKWNKGKTISRILDPIDLTTYQTTRKILIN